MTDLKERVSKSVCPVCGGDVVVPRVLYSDPKDIPSDPIVWCSEMGHWAGRLSQCNIRAGEQE